MSFKVKTFRQVWRRLYSTLSRKPGFVKNNLIMGQKRPSGIGSTLWGYFNYPSNVMFVTTNIFSFAALVTYNTMATIRYDQILEQEMLAAQLLTSSPSEQLIISQYDEEFVNNHKNNYYNNIPQNKAVISEPQNDTILTQLKNNILKHLKETKTTTIQQDHAVTNLPREIVESPLTQYIPESMVMEKRRPVNSINALSANASLFSLFYSYHLYESIVKEDWKESKQEALNPEKDGMWKQEVERVGNLSLPILNNFKKKHASLFTFYRVWNEDDMRQMEQVDRVFKFKFPGWRIYPLSLSKVCKQLHDNKIDNVKDFQLLYKSIYDVKMKSLSRLWFFDHSEMLKDSNEYVMNEYFFNRLIQDSFKNKDFISFKKYCSIILNPGDAKASLFFPLQLQYNSHQIHLDTLLSVFHDYILLQKRNYEGKMQYDDEILRIVQLIKNNGYLDKNGTAQILLQEDHPPIPDVERKRYFENISNNKTLGSLLYEVSQLQQTSSN